MLHTDSVNLTDAEHVDEIIFQSISAQDEYIQTGQGDIDRIVSNMADTAHSQHLHLARVAVDETGCGVIEDKAAENIYVSSGLELKLRAIASVGTVEKCSIDGYQMIAEPIGILASFPPVVHSVATILLQALLSVKTRNPIVFSFHPSVYESSLAAAQLMQEAAKKAGAPDHAIQWLPHGSAGGVQALLGNPEVSCILADGEVNHSPSESLPDIPILGTGVINTPCLIDRSADIEQAATDVVSSRCFDNGLVPTVEQTVIISREIYFQTLDLMMQKTCHLVNEQERVQLEQLLFDSETGEFNPECTGCDAARIAEMAGFSVPAHTKLILAEIGGVGPSHPLSRPKNVPVLSVLVCESRYEGLCFCEALLEFSTSSHTAVLHARDKSLITEFTGKLKVMHSFVNRPATRGDLAEFAVFRGNNLTTAMDRQVGNPTTAPLCFDMLLTRKLVQQPKVRKREWKIPEKILYSPGSILHLQSIKNLKRTLIVTNKELVDSECMDRVFQCLNDGRYPVQTDIFCNIGEVANIASIEQGVECMEQFRPTTLLAVGDSSTMDTAKVMNYFYHKHDGSLLELRFDLSGGDFPICSEEERTKKTILITIPAQPGSGSEMNGSVTLFNDSRERWRTLQSCDLIPDVCLVDSRLFSEVDKNKIPLIGMNVLSYALEAYVSPLASDYSDSMAMNAIKLVFKHLTTIVDSKQPAANEKIFNAAAMTGMATSNAKTGLTLAMTHSLVGVFRLSPDLCANILLPHIIKYNGVGDPSRYNPLMPGSRYLAHERYQEVAENLGLPCKSPEQSVESLIEAIHQLQEELNLPCSIKDCGIGEEEYVSQVGEMTDQVFKDHSTATNPRLPLLKEIETLFKEL